MQPSVRDLQRQIAALEAQVAALVTALAQRDARIETLECELAKARKNSRTSSKPPSSDIVKPRASRNADGSKRKKGGQPGHERHERTPFSAEDVNEFHEYTLETCPVCGDAVYPTGGAPRILQQVDLVEAEKIRNVSEHRVWPYWCEVRQQVHYAAMPPEAAKAGLVGPKLMVHIACLKGACHASFSTIRKYVRDVLGMTISRGQLSKVIQKVAASLDGTYNELCGALAGEAVLNIDETGHKEDAARLWTWCLCARNYTVFTIRESRSSQLLFDLLGENFDGVIGSDYMGAYRKFIGAAGGLAQFCLAHLIRDVKYMTTLASKDAQAHGKALLGYLRDLFHTIHAREEMSEAALRAALDRIRDAFLVQAIDRAPDIREARNLKKRLLVHGDAYFTFITTPGIDPTNNIAEQAIRFVVLDRHVTQGTRSPKGRQWCERIWTVIATCAAQGRSVHEYLSQALAAHFQEQPAPSLLPHPT